MIAEGLPHVQVDYILADGVFINAWCYVEWGGGGGRSRLRGSWQKVPSHYVFFREFTHVTRVREISLHARDICKFAETHTRKTRSMKRP
jgi:hypothetical protein